ncbi:cysteine hydrolase family protein [Demequina flava]|uniref:cysteine hydrolase family protein n=1 Tax=Demequina flava TaxID=1095025 RepID=UPI0009E324F2|nr:isochorismatase family cysteine hydrolase [Demequina flava]
MSGVPALAQVPAGAALVADDQNGALVVIDVQRSFGDPDFIREFGLTDEAMKAVSAAIDTMQELVSTARGLGIPVVWVELASDPTQPWQTSNWLAGNPMDAPLDATYPCVEGTVGAEWFRVAPEPGEIVVKKRRYSGFHGTDLENELRHAGITWLVMAGLTTECCVATTALDAFQTGFPVVVASDATAAYDLPVHTAALRQLSDNAALISTTSDIVELWHTTTAARKVAS